MLRTNISFQESRLGKRNGRLLLLPRNDNGGSRVVNAQEVLKQNLWDSSRIMSISRNTMVHLSRRRNLVCGAISSYGSMFMEHWRQLLFLVLTIWCLEWR